MFIKGLDDGILVMLGGSCENLQLSPKRQRPSAKNLQGCVLVVWLGLPLEFGGKSPTDGKGDEEPVWLPNGEDEPLLNVEITLLVPPNGDELATTEPNGDEPLDGFLNGEGFGWEVPYDESIGVGFPNGEAACAGFPNGKVFGIEEPDEGRLMFWPPKGTTVCKEFPNGEVLGLGALTDKGTAFGFPKGTEAAVPNGDGLGKVFPKGDDF